MAEDKGAEEGYEILFQGLFFTYVKQVFILFLFFIQMLLGILGCIDFTMSLDDAINITSEPHDLRTFETIPAQ